MSFYSITGLNSNINWYIGQQAYLPCAILNVVTSSPESHQGRKVDEPAENDGTETRRPEITDSDARLVLRAVRSMIELAGYPLEDFRLQTKE